jgi:hypothetical protein
MSLEWLTPLRAKSVQPRKIRSHRDHTVVQTQPRILSDSVSWASCTRAGTLKQNRTPANGIRNDAQNHAQRQSTPPPS